MKLEQSFEVAAPLERVWTALIDVERVAPCLPGASVTGRNDDGSYNGNFKVKIGPTSAAYSGKLLMEDVDEGRRTATMQAQGTDKRGQGGAKATIVSSVTEGAEGPGSTRVEVVTDYHITGRLARFGRGGMIEDISNRLLGEFAKCLQGALAGTDAPSPDSTSTAVTEAAAVAAAASAETEAAPGAATEAAQGAATEPAPGGGAPTSATPGGAPSTFSAQPPMAEAEPVQGLSLMASVIWKQAKRNPAPILAMVLGFLLALRVFRHRD
jgi:uncharacterized protein